MKRLAIPTAVFATLLATTTVFAIEPIPEAATAQPQSQVYYTQQPVPQYQYQYQPIYNTQQQQREGLWSRMMELERRKNNAILRFFGLR